jgi:hypothetical protein
MINFAKTITRWNQSFVDAFRLYLTAFFQFLLIRRVASVRTVSTMLQNDQTVSYHELSIDHRALGRMAHSTKTSMDSNATSASALSLALPPDPEIGDEKGHLKRY